VVLPVFIITDALEESSHPEGATSLAVLAFFYYSNQVSQNKTKKSTDQATSLTVCHPSGG